MSRFVVSDIWQYSGSGIKIMLLSFRLILSLQVTRRHAGVFHMFCSAVLKIVKSLLSLESVLSV